MDFTLSVCPYCACGCGMLLETRDGRLVGTHPGADHPSSQGSLCMRGWNAVEAPAHRDRILAPLVRENGKLVPVPAEKALEVIARGMKGLRAKKDKSVLFCVGPTRANEDAFAVKKLARALDARACTTDLAGLPAARYAIRKVFGRRYLPSGLDTVANADLVWIFGADPRACPQLASRLFEATQAGAKIVQFDIFNGTADGDSRTAVPIPPERFGLLPLLLQKAAFEADRIGASVKAAPGFAAFAKAWQPGEAPPLPEHPWLPDTRIQELVAALLRAKNPAFIIGERWLSAAGAGEATVQLLQALVLLGAGERIVPMTGEANSWGTWDILAPGKEDSAALLDLLDPAGTRKFDAVFILGEDLLRRVARPSLLAERLSQAGLVVLIDCFHTGAETCAHVVLPSTSFAERDGTVTSMFGVVQRWQKAIEPLGDSAPDRDWIARIGSNLGIKGWPGSPTEWFAEMGREAPAYQSQSLERLVTGGAGTSLDGTTALTFSPPKLPVAGAASKEFPFNWVFGSHPAVWSTGAVSEREEILKREVNQSLLNLSPADLAKLGLRSGSPVKVIASGAEATMTAQEDRRLPEGVLLAIPLPGSAAHAVRGFFPDADSLSIGNQPVPVRLEKI